MKKKSGIGHWSKNNKNGRVKVKEVLKEEKIEIILNVMCLLLVLYEFFYGNRISVFFAGFTILCWIIEIVKIYKEYKKIKEENKYD